MLGWLGELAKCELAKCELASSTKMFLRLLSIILAL